jgi:hypothetical protein
LGVGAKKKGEWKIVFPYTLVTIDDNLIFLLMPLIADTKSWQS